MTFFPIPRFRLRPAELIISSFAALVLLGTALLVLPGVSRREPLSFIDALFTATSAACVTGLVVVDTGSHFTLFGQGIILCLIQVGGLGIVTLSALLFHLLKKSMSMRNREAILRTVSSDVEMSVGKFLQRILLLALSVELCGTLLLTLSFLRNHTFLQALYLGLFHSISAFCNAGFALFSDNLISYSGTPLANITVMALIIIGGLGFAVILELHHALTKRRPFSSLSLHSRVVILSSAGLILLGTLLFFLVERGNSLRDMPLWRQVMVSFFQSITSRTAGFNSVAVGHLANTTLFLLILLMFIGGASGSCAGGIKVNTFSVLVAMFRGRLHGRSDVNLFRRRMSQTTLTRALSVTILSFLLITAALMLLMMTELGEVPHDESRGKFLELAFEATSAFGTVGLSTGLTPELTVPGRLIVTFLMFAGRVGPLTLAMLLHSRQASPLRYPEEDMIIG